MAYREPVGRFILGDGNGGAFTLTHRRRVSGHSEVASTKD